MASGRYARRAIPILSVELEEDTLPPAYESLYTRKPFRRRESSEFPTLNARSYLKPGGLLEPEHTTPSNSVRKYALEYGSETHSGNLESVKGFAFQVFCFVPYSIGIIVILYYLLSGITIAMQWIFVAIAHIWPYIQSSEIIPPLANLAGIIQGIAIIAGTIWSIFKFFRKK